MTHSKEGFPRQSDGSRKGPGLGALDSNYHEVVVHSWSIS